MTPPNEHTSEGGRDDRARGPVPCGIDPTRVSSAQVLKVRNATNALLPRQKMEKNIFFQRDDEGGRSSS